jgi:cell division protein FtsL
MLVQKKQELYVYEQEAASPAPKIVQKADKQLRVKCLILVSMAILIAVVTTMQSAAIVQAGYDLVKVKSQVAKLEKENELLRLDIAKLKSPQRIEAIAMNELGMVIPRNAYFAVAATPSADQSLTVPVQPESIAEQMLSAIKVHKAEASKGR